LIKVVKHQIYAKHKKKKKDDERKKREEQAAKKQAERDFYDNKRPESGQENLRASQRTLKAQGASTDRSHWAKGAKNIELGGATILDDVIDDIMADFNAQCELKVLLQIVHIGRKEQKISN